MPVTEGWFHAAVSAPRTLGVVLDRLADRCDAMEIAHLTVPGYRRPRDANWRSGRLDQLMDTLRMLAATGRRPGAARRHYA